MTHQLPDIYYQDKQLSTTAIENATSDERYLWLMVLDQLFTDAKGRAGCMGQKEKKKVQLAAIKWFVDGGSDFNEVCWMAGVNPEWVQEKVVTLLRQAEIIA